MSEPYPATLWAIVRKLYEDSAFSIDEICSFAGISKAALHKRRVRQGWASRRPRLERPDGTDQPDQPERACLPGPSASAGGAPFDRADIARRLWAALHRHLKGLEGAPTGHDEGRAAQNLATLARTLEKLIEVERDMAETPQRDTGAPIDEGPNDIDAFRDEVARRLEALLASGAPQ